MGRNGESEGNAKIARTQSHAHWQRREAGPTSDILDDVEIERAYRVRGGRVPFLTMPLRAAAASVTPLDGPVEVVADSESQDGRREGVELAAEGSALCSRQVGAPECDIRPARLCRDSWACIHHRSPVLARVRFI